MKNLALFEIFEEVAKQKTKEAKIVVLHAHSSASLKMFLGYVFDPNIKWFVPEGAPPYESPKEDAGQLVSRLWQEFKMIQHFNSTGPYPDMVPGKRENLFMGFIQNIHPKDAELIIYVKDNRALPQKGIDRNLIGDAFPLLVEKWGEVPVKTPLEPSPASTDVVEDAVSTITEKPKAKPKAKPRKKPVVKKV